MPEGLAVVGEERNFIEDIGELQQSCTKRMNLTDRIKSLNTDQARVFNRVSEHLLHQKKHESGLCSCSDYKPLRLFVSGVGGTGKSFLIEAITAQVAKTWSELDSSQTCAVAAPTGLAAFNVGGVTIHRLFQLPVEHDAKTGPCQRTHRSSWEPYSATSN